MSADSASVQEWIGAIAAEGDAMEGLAANYQFLLENYQAFITDGIEPSDMPYFDQQVKEAIFHAARFGAAWEPAHPSYHVVHGATGVHSLHHQKERAEAIADEQDDRWVETAEVEDTGTAITDQISASSEAEATEAVTENLKWLRKNIDATDAVELQPSELPAGELFMKTITMHSVIFGTLAMLERPDGEFVVVESGNITGVYVRRSNAEAAAPKSAHIEALQPADSSQSGFVSRLKTWVRRRIPF